MSYCVSFFVGGGGDSKYGGNNTLANNSTVRTEAQFFLAHFDIKCHPHGRRVIVKFVSLMTLCAFTKSQENC